jgi:hypothetical protein
MKNYIKETNMNKVPAEDVPQEFQKAWLYANDFMADAIKNEEHCKVFLKSVTCWTEEEKEFLFEAWILMKTGKGKAADDLSTLYDYYEEDEYEEEYKEIEEEEYEEEETTKDKKG